MAISVSQILMYGSGYIIVHEKIFSISLDEIITLQPFVIITTQIISPKLLYNYYFL